MNSKVLGLLINLSILGDITGFHSFGKPERFDPCFLLKTKIIIHQKLYIKDFVTLEDIYICETAHNFEVRKQEHRKTQRMPINQNQHATLYLTLAILSHGK